MFTRRDRVELSVLGLLVLGWALVFAPVLHAFEHAHGHAHHHGAPSGLPDSAPVPHGANSVEHQQSLFVDAVATPVLLASWRPVEPSRSDVPEAPTTAARVRPEQPQGP